MFATKCLYVQLTGNDTDQISKYEATAFGKDLYVFYMLGKPLVYRSLQRVFSSKRNVYTLIRFWVTVINESILAATELTSSITPQ